ncbi:MAG: helix-hairpin-helix domain-containing protein [Candidatus Staskawiczbacteria bacterium]|nr:helix-hairpin-helix domain-containing protein [Candidatus Staskawiczbacteria bacterium]
MNKEIAEIFGETIRLLEIKGDKALSYKIRAYRNAINILNHLKVDISDIYKEKGLKGIRELGIGEKNAKKIEEYIKHERIKEFEELNEETAIQNVIAHFFQTKGLGLQELKENAKKRKIIYSRYTKPAKQLLDLAGSVEASKEAITKIANWANSRKLDYTIETVFKKWLELDRLKPKEIVKKPFYRGDPMIFSETKKKWFVIKDGEWLEYAGKKEEIEWKIVQ